MNRGARRAVANLARVSGIARALDALPWSRRWIERRWRPALWDGWLVSYPKSGRTWLRLMLGRAMASAYDLPGDEGDWVELKRLARRPGVPRICVTHDDGPHHKAPGELSTDKAAYAGRPVVLLVRDPRDVVVSHFHQATRRERYFDGTISEFIRHERHGVDTLLRFLSIWHANRHVPDPFVVVRYEDMLEDPARELRRAAAAFGIALDDAAVGAAVEEGRFENMRRIEADAGASTFRLRPGDPADEATFKTRRGKAGTHREELSAEDVAWLDERIRRELPAAYGYGGERA